VIGFLIFSILVIGFIIPAYATNFEVIIPQGAHNRLCATFHNCYSPEEISIQTGDTITWPNEDSEPHTVTSGLPGKSDGYFDSGLYKHGESWLFTFNEPGNFDYYCTIHPWMIGKVLVLGESKTPQVSIPQWIKTNAGWWANDQISDSDFIQGIQFLIKEGIIRIPQTSQSESFSDSQKIPEWIKNNAGWWSQGMITDDDFIKGIQFLIENGIIRV
jgi:plastocyanin